MSEKSKEAFVVVFDKDRGEIFNIMASIVSKEGASQFVGLLNDEGIKLDTVASFFQEIYEKRHELGFCENKNCKELKK